MVPIRRLLVFLFFINSATRLFFAHTHQGENAAKTRHYAHFNAKGNHTKFKMTGYLEEVSTGVHAANNAAQVKRVSERNVVVQKGGDGFEENVKCKRNSFRSQEVMQVPSAVAFTADYPKANHHPPKNN